MSSLSPSKFKRKACKILLNDGHDIKNIKKKKKKQFCSHPWMQSWTKSGSHISNDQDLWIHQGRDLVNVVILYKQV
jgi:hypothetical protein